MTAPTDPTGPGDPLDPVVADYLQRVEAGRAPDRGALVAEHPELADRLRAFFADLDRLGKQASAFRLPDPDSTAAADGSNGTDLPRVRYIGDYELVEEIARGGMGVVYRARQVSLNRTVALKMILAGTYATPAAVARFKQEAEAAAGLDHPNILPIYEVGDHDGHQYFSMKLVNGPSLGTRLTNGPRTDVRGLVALLSQVARAVHFAHQRGILHRDLKPSNILLEYGRPAAATPPPRPPSPEGGGGRKASDSDRSRRHQSSSPPPPSGEGGPGGEGSRAQPTPYVTDFGLAKKVDADDGSTRTGAVVGTPAYMAPEQARGEKGLSTAADVYSLGAILYEVLTGRPPFRGDTVLETLRQVTDREPDHPQRADPRADRDLSVIALKCLEKDPARRYPSAAALADDLDRWLAGRPIEARPAGTAERVMKWARRNPAVAALCLSLTLAMVSGTVISTHFAAQANSRAEANEQSRREARHQEDLANQAREAAEAAKALSERRLYAAQVLLAQSALDQVQVRQARRALDATDWRQRGWEWQYLHRAADTSRATLDAGGTKKLLTFSPDGRRLFWAGSYDGLFVADVDRPDAPRRLSDFRMIGRGSDDSPVPDLAVAPDLSVAAVHARDGLVLAVEGAADPIPLGPRRKAAWEFDSPYGAVTFSADGRRLYAAGEKRLACWTVATRELAWELPLDTESASVMAVSRDETLAAVGFPADNTVRVIDLRTKAEVFRTEKHLNQPTMAEFSPDGKRLITHCAFRNPRVWDLASRKQLLQNTSYWAAWYAVSPDGKLGVMGMSFGDVVLFDPVTGRDLRVCRGHTHYVSAVALSPDGKWAASAGRDRTVRVWDTATGRLRQLFIGHADSISALAFSPDGKTLASGAGDRTVKLWDLDGDPPARRLELARYDVRAWHLLRDGRHLLVAQAQNDQPGSVEVWDLHTGKAVRRVGPHGGPKSGGVFSLALSADERWLVTGAWDGTLKVWDFRTGSEVRGHTLRPPDSYPDPGPPEIDAVAFAPDGSRYVAGRPDGFVTAWDRETGKEAWSVAHPADSDTVTDRRRQAVKAVYYTPDGRRVVVVWRGYGTRVTVHDAATGARVGNPVEVASEARVAFAPDGRTLAVAAPKRVVLLDLGTAREIGSVPQPKTVSALAFSPDGTRLAMGLYDTGWGDPSIELADVATGRRELEVRGHGSYVSALAWLPGGRRLVSGSFDNTVKVWDPANGQEVLSLAFTDKSDDRVEHVLVTPDGGRILATNGFPDGGSGGRNVVAVWRAW